MDSYYNLTTSNNTEGNQYKINLDALDLALLPIDKLLSKYQQKDTCTKIKIFNVKNTNKLIKECAEEIKGNHFDYEIEECESFEQAINCENQQVINCKGQQKIKCENMEIGGSGNVKMEDCGKVESKEGNIDIWWETLLAIDDITESKDNVADILLDTQVKPRPKPARFSKNWHKKHGTGTHKPHDDTYGVLDSESTVELLDENEFVCFLRYIQVDKKRSNIVHCSACEVDLTVNKKNISQHFAGIKHRVLKFKSEMQCKAVFKAENEHGYLWCKVCALSFECKTPDDLFKHTADGSDHDYRHDTIVALIESEDITYDEWCHNITEEEAFCNTCLEHVPFNYNALKWHINGFRHQETSSY